MDAVCTVACATDDGNGYCRGDSMNARNNGCLPGPYWIRLRGAQLVMPKKLQLRSKPTANESLIANDFLCRSVRFEL